MQSLSKSSTATSPNAKLNLYHKSGWCRIFHDSLRFDKQALSFKVQRIRWRGKINCVVLRDILICVVSYSAVVMIIINLLPWRGILRRNKRWQWLWLFSFVIILVIFFDFWWRNFLLSEMQELKVKVEVERSLLRQLEQEDAVLDTILDQQNLQLQAFNRQIHWWTIFTCHRRLLVMLADKLPSGCFVEKIAVSEGHVKCSVMLGSEVLLKDFSRAMAFFTVLENLEIRQVTSGVEGGFVRVEFEALLQCGK